MKYLILLNILFFSSLVNAQYNYTGKVEAGIINGSYETSAYFQTVHGVDHGQWFAGVGVGMDFYRYRTIPVFVELKRNIGRSVVRPFVLVEAGMNITYPTLSQKNQRSSGWQISPMNYDNGIFGKIGGGLTLNEAKRVKYAINAAFSYKTLRIKYKEIESGNIWADPWTLNNSQGIDKTIIFRLNRFMVGISATF